MSGWIKLTLSGAVLVVLAALIGPARADNIIVSKAYFEDPTGGLTFSEIRKQNFTPYERPFSKGYSASNFWFKLTIDPTKIVQSANLENGTIILRIRPPYLREVEFFDPAHESANRRLSGDYHSSAHDEYRSLNLSFVMPAGETPRDVYVRLNTSSSTFINFEAYPKGEIISHDYLQLALFALFISLIIISLFYAIVFLTLSRDRIFYFFSIRQACSLYWASAAFGIARFLIPDDRFNHSLYMCGSAIAITLSSELFDFYFLREFRTRRFIQIIQLALMTMPLISAVILLMGNLRLAMEINLTSALIFTLTSGIGSWFIYSVKTPNTEPIIVPKWLVSGSYTAIMIFLLMTLTPQLGLSPNVEFAIYSVAFHTTISTILLGIILTYRSIKLRGLKAAAETELAIMVERLKLEQLSRQDQAALLAMLSHELKTPLAGIQMSLGAVPIQKDKSKHISRLIGDMADLIDRCLNVGKIDDGVITLKIDQSDLSRLLTTKIENTLEPKRFTSQIQPHLLINTDQKLLDVILTNLIDNAKKYSAPDHPIIIETKISTVEEKSGVEIIVSNWPRDEVWPDPKLLFQKYYRGASALRQAGSGLGLYLSYKLAERLGGELSYTPNDHHIRFRLWLPA